MKILVAVDTEKYSNFAAREASWLAKNTWADVTLLGLQSTGNKSGPVDKKLVNALKGHIEFFGGDSSPYGSCDYGPPTRQGEKEWELPRQAPEGRKTLRVIVRIGDALEGILSEAWKDEPDLIVVGSAKAGEPEWLGEINLPRKVASSAPCTVLVVKEEKTPDAVVCCLDHDHVSQESLEMINQLVTLHSAQLTIVGVADGKGLNEKVETKMNEVLRYYGARDIRSWVKLVRGEELGAFARDAAETSLVGLWLGKKSLLRKIFSKNMLEELVGEAHSSVLVLK